RHVASRIQSEEAEIDLDVTVRGLQPAQRQDALARGVELRAVRRKTGEFERGVGLDGRADFARAAGVDVEAAVGELAFEDAVRSPVDPRAAGRIPLRASRLM